MEVNPTIDQGPVRFVTDARLDFNHFTPVRKSYIVASSYRSGSQYLCWRLWQTGLLGAPSEVLNPTSELRVLMNRLKASSPSDYMTKLLGRRVTRNGVFGMKAHFHHFEAFLNDFPPLLNVLSPVTYIYISRADKVAQAVSMAKALQTNMWTSRMEEEHKPSLNYDRDMISKCLEDIEQQDLTWRQWFQAHNVTPFQVTYDQLTADAAGVVTRIIKLLGVENDAPDAVDVPPAKKQGDETNEEWIARFERETRAGPAQSDPSPREGTGSVSAPITGKADRSEAAGGDGTHLFDRFGGLIKSMPTGAASATGFLDLINLRRRYDVIVGRNRDLFRGARVLDVMSSYGFWSLAALEAGAAHVVGIEASSAAVATTRKLFDEHKVDPASHDLVNSDIITGLQSLKPNSFDLVMCLGSFEQCDFRAFFHHLSRLQPKQVILDTGIVLGEGPIIRFSLDKGEILGMPNHPLIMFLCDMFNFRWRLINWRGMDISNWTGIHEYERDQRRTYILESMP